MGTVGLSEKQDQEEKINMKGDYEKFDVRVNNIYELHTCFHGKWVLQV